MIPQIIKHFVIKTYWKIIERLNHPTVKGFRSNNHHVPIKHSSLTFQKSIINQIITNELQHLHKETPWSTLPEFKIIHQ